MESAYLNTTDTLDRPLSRGQVLYHAVERRSSVLASVSLGVVLAIVAAIGVACTGLAIRLGSDDGRTVDGLVIVLVCNLLILLPLTVFLYHPTYRVTVSSLGAFLAAGLTGTLLGRLCYFSAIATVGASRTEPIKATQPLHATAIAVLILGESISSGRFGGIVLIIAGVAIVTVQSSRDTTLDASQQETARGALFAFSAALFFGLEPVWAKIGLADGTPVLVGLSLRVGIAALGFFAYLRYRGNLPTVATLRSRSTRWYVGAGIANTVFILSYYGALELSPVTVVVPIVQTSPLVVVLLSVVLLPRRLEAVDRTIIIGCLLVVVGAVAVTVVP
jgi:drug/metabolite transporter (DMT)-like permease